MKVIVRSHVETESERGFNEGMDKAISLLNRRRIEIERHRMKCKEWREIYEK
jgi:hypothetical protein